MIFISYTPYEYQMNLEGNSTNGYIKFSFPEEEESGSLYPGEYADGLINYITSGKITLSGKVYSKNTAIKSMRLNLIAIGHRSSIDTTTDYEICFSELWQISASKATVTNFSNFIINIKQDQQYYNVYDYNKFNSRGYCNLCFQYIFYSDIYGNNEIGKLCRSKNDTKYYYDYMQIIPFFYDKDNMFVLDITKCNENNEIKFDGKKIYLKKLSLKENIRYEVKNNPDMFDISIETPTSCIEKDFIDFVPGGIIEKEENIITYSFKNKDYYSGYSMRNLIEDNVSPGVLLFHGGTYKNKNGNEIIFEGLRSNEFEPQEKIRIKLSLTDKYSNETYFKDGSDGSFDKIYVFDFSKENNFHLNGTRGVGVGQYSENNRFNISIPTNIKAPISITHGGIAPSCNFYEAEITNFNNEFFEVYRNDRSGRPMYPTIRIYGNVVNIQGELKVKKKITANTDLWMLNLCGGSEEGIARTTINQKIYDNDSKTFESNYPSGGLDSDRNTMWNYLPENDILTVCQGSSKNIWLFRVYGTKPNWVNSGTAKITTKDGYPYLPGGICTFSRYRTGSDAYEEVAVDVWLPFNVTWIANPMHVITADYGGV